MIGISLLWAVIIAAIYVLGCTILGLIIRASREQVRYYKSMADDCIEDLTTKRQEPEQEKVW